MKKQAYKMRSGYAYASLRSLENEMITDGEASNAIFAGCVKNDGATYCRFLIGDKFFYVQRQWCELIEDAGPLYCEIDDAKIEGNPQPRLDAMGYTRREGSPTCYLVRLKGTKRYRRLYVWQFSNAGTVFVKIGSQSVCLRNDEDVTLFADRNA